MPNLQLLMCVALIVLVVGISTILVLQSIKLWSLHIISCVTHQVQQALLKATSLAPGGDPLINAIARVTAQAAYERDRNRD